MDTRAEYAEAERLGAERSLAEHKAYDARSSSEGGTRATLAGDADASGAGVNAGAPKAQLDRLYRKLDWRIIPALWVLYFLSSFGSAAYGNTLTMNYEKGHSLPAYLHVSPHQLKTASAMSYVGFIVFDLPMNLLMTVVAPNSWMARIIVSVGIVEACYAAAKSGAGIIVLRLAGGIASAGVWPGMAYYISMWYPAHRTARRIGYYYTAAQLSAAAAGLVAAGFQKMDGTRGYTGYQWLYIVYGSVTTAVGLTLAVWLPGRPRSLQPRNARRSVLGRVSGWLTPPTRYPLNDDDDRVHDADMHERYSRPLVWEWRDLLRVILDPRLYPLVLMYFGVVGCGIGIEVFATTIIRANNPKLSGIDLSLLTAPIWLFDLAGILLITPISDKLSRYRGIIFSLSTLVIIAGMFVTTYAHGSWSRWGGLLICGFGLGPTVPITMTWAATILGARHGDVGAAAATALTSGLGNLGSVTTTYALYSGWKGDADRMYRYSNMTMVALLGMSIVASAACTTVQWLLGDFGNTGLLENTFLGTIFRRRKPVLTK